MTPEQELQLEKLARTLVKGNLASNYKEALQTAREILKIPEESKEAGANIAIAGPLPKVDDIEPIPVSLGVDFDRDKTIREILEEDAKTIYGKESSQKN